jgi:hypothetical protein
MLNEDLTEFFNLADFAQPITISNNTESATVNAIVDHNYVEAFADVEGRRIKVRIITSEATFVMQNANVSIGAKYYRVTQVQPLFDGLTTDLILMEIP